HQRARPNIHDRLRRPIMINPTSKLRVRLTLCAMLATAGIMLLNAPRLVDAQGLVKGAEQGAREGNKAAGPVGGVLGGAIGGVVGGVAGAITGQSNNQPAPNDKQGKAAKTDAAKTDKGAKSVATAKDAKSVQVLTQQGAPRLTAEQIVANSDANIDRIKKELN